MEFTREIYWNVGHGLLTLAPMYGLLLVALGVFVLGCLKRIRVYRLGQPVDRTDQRGERIRHLLASALLQTKVFRVPGAGTAHRLQADRRRCRFGCRVCVHDPRSHLYSPTYQRRSIQ